MRILSAHAVGTTHGPPDFPPILVEAISCRVINHCVGAIAQRKAMGNRTRGELVVAPGKGLVIEQAYTLEDLPAHEEISRDGLTLPCIVLLTKSEFRIE